MCTRLQKLPPCTRKQLSFIHDKKVPAEIREHLGKWIEDNLHNATRYSNCEMYELEASRFFFNLAEEVKRVSASLSQRKRTLLNKSAIKLCDSNPRNLIELYVSIMQCLNVKIESTNHEESAPQGMDVWEGLQRLQEMQSVIRKTTNELQRANQQKGRKHMFLIGAFQQIIQKSSVMLNLITNKYISQWKTNQLFPDIGSSTFSNAYSLDDIQRCCESLADIIWHTKEQICLAKKIKLRGHINEEYESKLAEAMVDVVNLLKMLLSNAFIVVNQPPRVMKMNVRFKTSVRMLIANNFIRKIPKLSIKVTIVSEAQAQLTLCTNKTTNCSAGELVNYDGSLQYDESTNVFAAIFDKMRLKKITRGERKMNERVVDEKFALRFELSFSLVEEGLKFSLCTLSLPCVVVVHGCQERMAWSTIIWDNMCVDSSRQLFQVSKQLPLNILIEALSKLFSAFTRRGLTEESMSFLYEKALKGSIPSHISNSQLITFSQFCKDTALGRCYTFWDWVYEALKVTREHLYGPWLDGSVFGFIHSVTAETYLTHCIPGTFILRFTESVLGGISIAWVNEDCTGQRNILHIQPFTAKDLVIRSLADRICDLDELVYLFPYTPKLEAFGRYKTTPVPLENNSYIAAELRTVLICAPNNQIAITKKQKYPVQSPSDETTFNERVLTEQNNQIAIPKKQESPMQSTSGETTFNERILTMQNNQIDFSDIQEGPFQSDTPDMTLALHDDVYGLDFENYEIFELLDEEC